MIYVTLVLEAACRLDGGCWYIIVIVSLHVLLQCVAIQVLVFESSKLSEWHCR